MAKAPLRLRLAKAILGTRAKEFIPSLAMSDGWYGSSPGRLNEYLTKHEQLQANVGWCFTANNAIAEPTAAVNLQLFKVMKNGEKEQIFNHELLELLDAPNLAHTGDQLRQLHFTYMNFVGESYIYMRDLKGGHFIPSKGRLPAALDIFPAHLVQFKLGETYTKSTVKYGQNDYPLTSFIRDLNPDPEKPYFGRSIIRASALTIDTENQMKEWNRGVFANSARPSLIFKTNEVLDDAAYNRWKEQFVDQHTGTENAYKPLLIEGGDAHAYMLNQQDLDFLQSRKFSKDEILAMWRVSPGVLGMLENANRSNLQAAFYLHAYINVLPRIRQFVKQLNATLVKVYDPTLELGFENPVPEDVEAKLNAAKAGVNNWWTIDEVRAMYGDEPLPDDLGSQMIVVGKGALSLESVLNPPEPAETQITDDENDDDSPKPGADSEDDKVKADKHVPSRGKKKDLTADEREQIGEAKKTKYDYWAAWFEGQLMTAIVDQFNAQRNQILAHLDVSRIGTKGYTRKDWLDDLLDWAAASESMQVAMTPAIQATLIQAGRDAYHDLGLEAGQFDPFTPAIAEYFENRALNAAKDINDETAKQLRATMSEGVQAGESSSELRARVELVMGHASTVRADRIARYEVTHAQSYGDIYAWTQSGIVEGKEWYTAHDERVCVGCSAMDGKVIGLSENFFDKGDSLVVDREGKKTPYKLKIDYEDVGGPAIHNGCRCVLLPVRVQSS